MKRALITGITGQDGSYLAELLLDKGYEVFAIIRRASTFNTGRIDHLFRDIHEKENKMHLIYGDLTDGSSINKIIRDVNPDEIYNLGAQSHVRVSFDIPENTCDVNALGTLRLLEAIRENNLTKKIKFYQASTSELFGKVQEIPQSETTPFYPRSPYGVSKLYAYWMVKNYREAYGLYACNGILFNHESPRRGETFVTRKITRALTKIKLGLQDRLYLGNLDAKRDWGYAKDYVEMMWLMLQQEKPDDYVIGTGETHSIREFLEVAISYLELDWKSNGKIGVKEKYLDKNGKVVIEIDPNYFRPTEVDLLLSNPKKAKKQLGWKAKTKFEDLVKIMVDNDLELAKNEKILKENRSDEIRIVKPSYHIKKELEEDIFEEDKPQEIKLMKSTFYNEKETKDKLCQFIQDADILSMNKECKIFEENFSKYQKRKFSIFVTSGSSANLLLIQSLLNLGKLKKGDRVGVSALTWSTNIMPLIQLGLKPILIDCEINTVNVSLRKIKEKKIDSLFLTNALGFCSDIDEIAKYCKKKKILFIEDNCESFGTKCKGKLLGNFGLASTFSFFVGHHLSTIEGGMICTDNQELYENLLVSRIHGWGRNLPKEKQEELKKKHKISDFYDKYSFYDLAYNVRPGEINGFLGNIQLGFADEIISKRENNFKKINYMIEENPEIINLELRHLTTISNFGVPLIFKNKEFFKKYVNRFKSNGVEIRPIISGNMENQPFFKKYGPKKKFKCKNAEFIHQNGFYCGNNPEMTEKEINFICDLLTK